MQSKDEKASLEEQLKFTMKDEMLKWFQRSKEKEIMEGDNNTKYYHAKANGRRRKSIIYSLQQEEILITRQESLVKHITDFYKGLFGPPDRSGISMLNIEMNKLSEEQKEEILRPFTMEELEGVVLEMENSKAPGPDGFLVDFYKKFLGIIKGNLKNMLDDFHKGMLDVKRLNHGIISLIPKYKDASQGHKFRPICLLNVSFKIITRVLMKRLTQLIGHLIEKTQTAFRKEIYIMEGVVVMHEILNSVYKISSLVYCSKLILRSHMIKLNGPL